MSRVHPVHYVHNEKPMVMATACGILFTAKWQEFEAVNKDIWPNNGFIKFDLLWSWDHNKTTCWFCRKQIKQGVHRGRKE